MKHLWKPAVLALLIAGLAFVQVPTGGGRPLADLLPAGAMLVLHSPDFNSLLDTWNSSPEKVLWQASANYKSFSRSKLFYRLQEAQGEFAAVAGLPADLSLVDSVAGGDSALALYDVGELRFVYLTRLPAARALESLLWQRRANFESRVAAGKTYFAKADGETGRNVAFAVDGDLFVLASDAELVARSLRLIAGEQQPAVSGADWYGELPEPGGRPALRLLYDMQAVAATPHFRSYWIQRNAARLREFRAGSADLYFEENGIREERTLVRAPDSVLGSPASPQLLAGLRSFVPDDADFFRIRGLEPRAAANLFGSKLLRPKLSVASSYDYAPSGYFGQTNVGAESQLETRIDVTPPRRATETLDLSPIEGEFERVGVAASAQFSRARTSRSGVLVETENAIVLSAAIDWNVDALTSLLTETAATLVGTSPLDVTWQARGTALEADGPLPLWVEARGNILVVTNSASLHADIARRFGSQPVVLNANEVSGLRHGIARVGYESLMRHLDFMNYGLSDDPDREPYLFSENIASLSRALARAEEMSITRSETAQTVRETVEYR